MLEISDRGRFLGLQIWEFSFHSLAQRYGHLFLREVVLRHPFRTLRGILEYRRFLQAGRREGDITYLFWGKRGKSSGGDGGWGGASRRCGLLPKAL